MGTSRSLTPSLLVALGLALSAAACAGTGAEARALDLAVTIQERQLEHFVQTFSIDAPARALAAAGRQAHTPSVAELLAAGAYPDGTTETEREALDRFYAARSHSAAFVEATHLNADGRLLADVLQTADRHALDPTALGADAIADRLGVLLGAESDDAIRNALLLSAEDQERLLRWMTERAALDGTLPSADAVFGAIASHGVDNPLPEFAGGVDRMTDALTSVATAAPELDLLLARGLIRYATAQAWSNVNLVRPELAAERGWDLEAPEQHPAIVQDRVLAGISALSHEPGFVASLLPTLEPPTPQYRRLVEGLAEYRAYVEAGGWETVTFERDLSLGARGDAVAALRRRLAAENYFDGDLTSTEFDAALRDALRNYQATHQMDGTGVFDEQTATSINIPAERRLAQIMVALDHWRSARSTRDADRERISVNVPDFHGELWDGDQLLRRWRVITGRTLHLRDARGQEVVAGRTPLFSDTMLYVVFNPYWNVPPEIRFQEYQSLIDADPMWPVNNGFELIPDDSGGDWLRQLPGPQNLLGAVKFLFPNEHDVYMHDTPAKGLFNRSIRAYSHGCIRTEDPLELAALLISRDRGWTLPRTERFIEQQLETGVEQWLSLQRGIPVHIEYVSVRGGDDGRIHFLADVYRYDRPLVDAAEERVLSRYRPGSGAEPAPGAAEEPVPAAGDEGGAF